MTEIKPIIKDLPKIATAFNFTDYQPEELKQFYINEITITDKSPDNAFKNRAQLLMFLRSYSNDTQIMLEIVKLLADIAKSGVNYQTIGFARPNVNPTVIYTTLEKFIQHLIEWYDTNDEDADLLVSYLQSIELVTLV